jgi:prolyl-tRNA editing enzyme YbaK/EbsC (Cys-tRNA(Pro) deacylase)
VREKSVSIEHVKAYFKQFNRETDILEFDVSSATVSLAAEALGVMPERIAKTLSIKGKEKPIILVVAGDANVDNRKFKDFFKTKASMLKFEEVEPLTGHPVGGVCPFALKDNPKVYLDVSLKRFETVFPACGSPNSAIELSCNELEQYVPKFEWVDVCKSWKSE